MKFRVTFEQQNEYGEWIKNWLDDNGHGFNHDDAEHIKYQLYNSLLGLVRNVQIVRIMEDK